MEPGEQLTPEATTGRDTNDAWHRKRMAATGYPTAEDKAKFAGLPLAGHPDPWERNDRFISQPEDFHAADCMIVWRARMIHFGYLDLVDEFHCTCRV